MRKRITVAIIATLAAAGLALGASRADHALPQPHSAGLPPRPHAA